ncbi:MAG: diguanylate cyclase [Deltaproteobacteria bacterium]|nr:MAG: diguanylate cyclase [Deltaproteobacteria bacterium]
MHSESVDYFPLSIYRQGTKILTITQLDKLSDTILDYLMEETGAQGSILWLSDTEQPDQFVLNAARGLVQLENETPRFKSSGDDPRIEGFPLNSPKPQILNNNLYLTLRSEGGFLGCAKLTRLPDGKKFGLIELKAVEAIGEFSGLAIKNAQRLEELARKGFKDDTTGSYNLAYLSDYIEKEILKTRRYNRTFSLVGLQIDNYQKLQQKIGQAPVAQAVERVILALNELLRDSDTIARISEREIYAFLPETDYFGSLMSIRRMDDVLKPRKYISNFHKDSEDLEELLIMMASSSFPRDGTDFDSLKVKIGNRMEAQRSSIYKKLDLEEKSFWEAVDLLMSKKGHKAAEDVDGLSRHYVFTSSLIDQTQKVIFLEVAQNPDMRGVLYLGVQKIDPEMSFLENHQFIEASATRIFILGHPTGDKEEEDRNWEIPQITPVFLSDERMKDHIFILYLNEDYAYGLICRRSKQGKLLGFHTGDSTLVEKLVSKLQDNYMLKKQL